MTQSTSETETRHKAPRITLTQATHFLLASNAGRQRAVSDCSKIIDFNTYWSPMRNAIASVHQTKIPNLQELIDETLKQRGRKFENYTIAARSYSLTTDSLGLNGEKVKRLQSNGFKPVLIIGGLSISVNPEVVLAGDKIYIQKLYFGKDIPMTEVVAQQIMALINWSIIPENESMSFLNDVWRGKVFQQSADQNASLERLTLNCKSFVSISDALKRQSGAA